jgi:hypothetical protein
LNGALPNLIVIGAQRSGTTSLHHYLDAHPEIRMAAEKETNFFVDGRWGNWARGVEWYLKRFDPDSPVRGEASPYYTNLPESSGVAERIGDTVPEAKLIYLVREPLERIASDYTHQTVLRLEHRPFEEAVMDPESPYVARSSYATQLTPFLDAIPRDQILVETHENLRSERNATLRRIFRFVGVDDSFTSPEFERRWQRSEGKSVLYGFASHTVTKLPKSGASLPRSVRWAAQRLVRGRLVPGPKAQKPVFGQRLREETKRRLAPEAEALRQMTGLPLDDWSV